MKRTEAFKLEHPTWVWANYTYRGVGLKGKFVGRVVDNFNIAQPVALEYWGCLENPNTGEVAFAFRTVNTPTGYVFWVYNLPPNSFDVVVIKTL